MMRKLIILLFCSTLVLTARCQGMGFGEPVPSVGISQNQHDALLSLLAPNHHSSQSNFAMDHQSSGNSGFDIHSLMQMISGGTTGTTGQSSTNHGPPASDPSNFRSPTPSSSSGSRFNQRQQSSGGFFDSGPQNPPNNFDPMGSSNTQGSFYDPTVHSSVSSHRNSQNNFHDPTGSSSGPPNIKSQGSFYDFTGSSTGSSRNSQSNFHDPMSSSSRSSNRHSQSSFNPLVPKPSERGGSRHSSNAQHSQDPMIAALERAQKPSNRVQQSSNSGMNHGNLPGHALPEMFGSHPLSGKASGNSMFGSLLRNNPQAAGHPTGSRPQQTIHREPGAGILGSLSGTRTNTSTNSLPNGAVTQGSSTLKPYRPPSVFQIKMQAKLYNVKATKLAPIMHLYEQEGCINPITLLPQNIMEVAKSAFSDGCQDPSTNNYCRMAQFKTPGFTTGRMNTQFLLQSMLTPESKTRIGSMLSRMSPSNMMSGGMGGMMAGMGGEMMNAEMMDRVLQLRQKLFPLECNEVVLTSMFKIGTCCYGKVNIPERYIMSQFLSRSFGAK